MRRAWLLLFISALAGLWLSWWRWGVPAAERQIQLRLESAFSSRLRVPTRIGRVQLHPLLLFLSFHDVKVGRDDDARPLFSCDRWTLLITPVHVSPSFPWVRVSFGKSDVERPVVDAARLAPLAGAPRPGAISSGLRLLPAHRVEWRGGDLLLPAMGALPALAVRDCAGSAGWGSSDLTASLSGTSPFGPLRLSARAGLGSLLRPSGPGWEGALSLDVDALESLTPHLPFSAGLWSGRAALSVKAGGGLSPFSVKAWSAGGRLLDAGWTPRGASEPWRFRGNFDLSPQRLVIKELSVLEGAVVSGTLRDPLQETGTADVTVELKSFDLERLRGRLPASWANRTPWRGAVTGRLRVTGSRDAPRWEAEWEGKDIGVGVIAAPSWRGTLAAGPEGIESESALLGGAVRLHASRESDDGFSPLTWRVSLQDLNLEEAVDEGLFGRAGGLLGGNFLVRPSSPTARDAFPWKANGLLKVEDASWADHKLKEPLVGYFLYDAGAFRYHGKRDEFVISLRREEAGWRLSELAFSRADGLDIRGAGRVSDPGGRLEFQGSVRNAPVRDLPPVFRAYPGVSGFLDLEGTLTGALGEPFFEGRAGIRDFRFSPAGSLHGAEARVRWDGSTLFIPSFEIDGTWEGDGSWSSSGGWFVESTFDRADSAVVAEAFRSSVPVSGLFSGQASLAGGTGPWQGWGNLTFSEGGWGPVVFQRAAAVFQWEKGEFLLEALDVRQSSGAMSLAGEVRGLKGWGSLEENPWTLRAQFKRFSLGSLWLDGEASGKGTLRGGGAFSGDVRSPSFWVNGVQAGPLTAHLSGRNGDWEASSISLAAGHAVGAIRLRRGSLDGRLTAKTIPASDVASRAGVSHPVWRDGTMDAAVSVSGPWRSPGVELNADWKGARANDVPFSSRLSARFRDGGWDIRSLAVRFPGGGTVEGFGVWGGSVTVRLDAVPLGEALRSLGARGDFGGSVDGEVQWRGGRRNPDFSAALSGRGVDVGGLEPFDWAGRVRYRDGELMIDEFQARTSDGVWKVSPRSRVYPSLDGGGRMRLANDLRNIRMGPLTFFGGLEAVGEWKTRPFSLECHLRAQSFWINQQFFEGDMARMVWSGDALSFSQVPGGFRNLSGKVRLGAWPQIGMEDLSLWEGGERRILLKGEAGPRRWDFTLEGRGLEAGSLMGLADLDWTMEGPVDVFLSGQGSPSEPRVEAEVLGKKGLLGPVPYDDLEAAVLWEGPAFRLRRFRMSRKKGYVLTGDGEFPTVGDDPELEGASLRFRLEEGDMSLLKEVWPGCRHARGRFRGEWQIRPGREGPETGGEFVLDGGSIKARRYFRRVSDLRMRLSLKDNRVSVQEASAKVGRGRLLASGSVGLRGLQVEDYDLSVRVAGRPGISVDVPQLSVPPGPLLRRFSVLRESLQAASQGAPLLALEIKGPHGQHLIKGEVGLEDTHFTYPPAKGAFSGLRRDSWLSEFWREAEWDVLLKTGRDTWYRNEFVHAQVEGSLSVRGRRGALRVDGRVGARQGAITYLGQTFEVRKGLIEVVTDPSDGAVIPYLSGEADRSVTALDSRGVASPDVVTMIVPRAPLGEIQPRFVSRNNPGLASDRVAQKALGLAGREDRPPTPEEKDQLLRAGLVQLVGSSAGPLANRLARSFGIDMISAIYEPDSAESRPASNAPSSPTALRGPLVDLLRGTGASAGVRLSDRIFGIYKFKVDEAQNRTYFHDEVQIIYRVLGSLHLRASTELDTRRLLGQPPNRQALIENQWRFGLPRRRPKTKSGLPVEASLALK